MTGSTAVQPLGDDAFAAMMAVVGGFESRPRLAVAVSGGADSLALAVLAQRWVAARGGELLALTVDHGLRPESATEAAAVHRLLTARSIAHQTLVWSGDKPTRGVEAAARAARYRLLTECCAREGILHLLTAHHADDQAETILLRFSRGSGPDGLAGIAPVTYLAPLRLVRPLLAIGRDRLRETCRVEGLLWFEDPTNHSADLARGRLRRVAPLLAAEGLNAQTLRGVGEQAAVQRRYLDSVMAEWLAATVTLSPFGYAVINVDRLAAADDMLALRVLGRVVVCVGGLNYSPRREALVAAWHALVGGRAKERSLGGCRIIARQAGRGKSWLVCRDAGQVADSVPITAGQAVHWDQRFTVIAAAGLNGGYRLAPVGGAGWKMLCRADAWLTRLELPGPVRASLPALWRDNLLIELADFGIPRPDPHKGYFLSARFIPPQPLAGAAFTVVSPPSHIIYCS